MKNREMKYGIKRIASALLSILGLMTLLTTFFPSTTAQSLDGFWQSDAYGLLVEIRGAKMITSQITAISCLRWWTAERLESGGKGEVVFKRGNDLIRLIPGATSDALLMREDVSISSQSLRRVNARPNTCSEKLANTSQNNYAVFWQTFAEQFALFPQYQVDWAAVDRKYRPQVTASTTPEELFRILREMILPFQNAHTNINAGAINRQYIGYKLDSEIGRKLRASSSLSLKEILDFFTQEAQQTKDIIESRYSEGKLRSYCNDVIYFGMLKNSIGYLRILGFDGYTKEGGIEQGAMSLEAALDDIFKDGKQMKGLIMDVRVNTGGADPYCLAIAARLTSAKYLAYSKVTRNSLSGPLRFTTPQPVWVDVSTRPGYRGKVVLLIGPDTLSGGETFALALMGRKPQVTSMGGEHTRSFFRCVRTQIAERLDFRITE